MGPPNPERVEGPGHDPQALAPSDQVAADQWPRYHRPGTAEDVACDEYTAAVLRGEWVQLDLRGGAA